jgi:hypothetical protein
MEKHDKNVITRQDRSPNGRQTIGYLTRTISGDTGQALWSGVVNGARARDLNLICFCAECLSDSRGFLAHANILYDLANAEQVDGIVTWASSIGTYISPDENRAFHERYRPLQIVTVGGEVEGFSSVLLILTDSVVLVSNTN